MDREETEFGLDEFKQKPQVFLNSITFNDGTTLPLYHNSIVVFTGANNCGKSQVLKDIEFCMDRSRQIHPIVIKNADFDFSGSIDEPEFFNSNMILGQNDYYHCVGSQYNMNMGSIVYAWDNHSLINDIYKLFVKRLSSELRLTSSNALKREDRNAELNGIYKLTKTKQLEEKISDYFYQAFGEKLVLNINELRTIQLHVGSPPNKQSYAMSDSIKYYEQIQSLPQLQDQGDGMRSFTSILLDTFTSEYPITLIDEPEAFLHPPQARILGKMLVENNQNDRQLLIATHSEDFLQGLLDAHADNVTVVRINRESNINHMSVLNATKIKGLWNNPLLRYSNILGGLFHEKVVVCESDADCLFYQALINAIYEHKGDIAPDIMFVHCGGISRIADVVAALKAVNVPVCAICDFDLINNSSVFKMIVEAFNMDWANDLEINMKDVYDWINGKNKDGQIVNLLKTNGKSMIESNAHNKYIEVEEKCKSAGLFIVPVGEMECFDKSIVIQKKDWVYEVLKDDLATRGTLEDARKFVLEIANFKTSENPIVP